MRKTVIVAAIALAAAGCGSKAAKATSTPTPKPSSTIAWDLPGLNACQWAQTEAWRNTETFARLSAMTELQDLALRQQRLGNHNLVKAWCLQHPAPTGSLCDWGIGTVDIDGATITAENCQQRQTRNAPH